MTITNFQSAIALSKDKITSIHCKIIVPLKNANDIAIDMETLNMIIDFGQIILLIGILVVVVRLMRKEK